MLPCATMQNLQLSAFCPPQFAIRTILSLNANRRNTKNVDSVTEQVKRTRNAQDALPQLYWQLHDRRDNQPIYAVLLYSDAREFEHGEKNNIVGCNDDIPAHIEREGIASKIVGQAAMGLWGDDVSARMHQAYST